MRNSVATLGDWRVYGRAPEVPCPRWMPLDPNRYPVRLVHAGPRLSAIEIFDLRFPLGFRFDWHYDYRNNCAVAQGFAGGLDIRDTGVVGDIKYVWEPARHQFLSALAFAVDGPAHVSYIIESLDSWIQENPYQHGVHWTSSLEIAERLISWSLLYPAIAGHIANDPALRSRFLGSVYLQLKRIVGNLSEYSSANNHLIGELVGVFMTSSCFAFWEECVQWREMARRRLEVEIRRQIGPDGVNRELALGYHLFTMELLLLAFAVGRNSGSPFSSAYAGRLRGMAEFIEVVATDAGQLPMFGDSDDARGFLVSQGEPALETVMDLAAVLLYEPPLFRFGNGSTVARAALAPCLALQTTSFSVPVDTRRELFEDAGLVCVRSTGGNVRLLFDFGPLGFTDLAAHGHADALSVWLAIGDRYFLVDAGTYAYHSHSEWRTYFRSTAAHNTARVDGVDQSEIVGRFLWGRKARARLIRFESDSAQASIEAEHDGYSRLSDPVIHRRCVRFDKAAQRIEIRDTFVCSGRHIAELFFHLDEGATVQRLAGGVLHVRWREYRILFSSPDSSCNWHFARGSTSPILGWRSRQFNHKQPIYTLRSRAQVDGTTSVRTVIRILK
jgi:hypothetical protein